MSSPWEDLFNTANLNYMLSDFPVPCVDEEVWGRGNDILVTNNVPKFYYKLLKGVFELCFHLIAAILIGCLNFLCHKAV